MANRNITLSLPEDVLREAKILAVNRHTSVSRLVADVLKELVERESGYALARQRQMALMERGLNLGTHGKITWTRDELHER